MGLPAPDWLGDPSFAKPTLITLSVWTAGTGTLIFLAGLKEVPQSLLEAAAIDGAGAWQRFRSVTLPLLTPVILFNLVMGVINSFQVFTQAMVIGGTDGRPIGLDADVYGTDLQPGIQLFPDGLRGGAVHGALRGHRRDHTGDLPHVARLGILRGWHPHLALAEGGLTMAQLQGVDARTQASPAPMSAAQRAAVRRRRLGAAVRHTVLALTGLVFAVPYFWMITSALKDNAVVFARTRRLVAHTRVVADLY